MLNKEQQNALSYILQGDNVFVTGGGGTGKTVLINYFVKHYNNKNIAVTSTTGTSAILIKGTTLHSYTGIGLGKGSMYSMLTKIKKKKYLRERWKRLDILIIDEISMLNPDLFDKLEEIARNIRRDDRPFGGIQLILSGDFCQLPCIDSNNFCFEAKSWDKCIDKTIYLKEIMRQTDKKLQKVLNSLRLGIKTDKIKRLVEARINAKLENEHGILPTKLYPLNRYVEAENNKELEKIAEENGEVVEYNIESVAYKKKNLEKFIKYIPASPCLQLTKGCQVMLIHNLDLENQLVNGSRGVVLDFVNDLPLVKFMNGHERIIDYHIWEIEENDTKIGSVEQIPLKLGYAFSIHKIQGATLDLVELNLKDIFEYGMGYVALSRVKNFKALSIKSINWSKIKCHPKAVNFYKNL